MLFRWFIFKQYNGIIPVSEFMRNETSLIQTEILMLDCASWNQSDPVLTSSFHCLSTLDLAACNTPTTALQRGLLICSRRLLNLAMRFFQWSNSAAGPMSSASLRICSLLARTCSICLAHCRINSSSFSTVSGTAAGNWQTTKMKKEYKVSASFVVQKY